MAKPELGIPEKKDFNITAQVLEKQNITSDNFFIQKAQIEIISEGTSNVFLATVRFIRPDTFLISLRSKAGIEAARIFLTKDTVLINDRINKQLLFGKPDALGRKFRFTSEIFPVLLGDFVKDKDIKNIVTDCRNGKAVLVSNMYGSRLIYNIDCNRMKVISTVREGSTDKTSESLFFEKFIKVNKLTYPSRIRIDYYDTEVNIRIERLESPWIGNIEFIPGKNYELKELL